jgi:hypothetical protein
LRPVLLAPFQY